MYQLTDWVKNAMAGELRPGIIETVVGHARVQEVFPAGKGTRRLVCSFSKASSARASTPASREDVIVSKTTISSLRRFKDDVAEVRAGLECGVLLADTNDTTGQLARSVRGRGRARP